MPKKASRLLEEMRRSKSKWKRKDLEALYEGYGFIVESRAKHDKVWHPEYPQLYTFLPRHTKIAVYLVDTAVKLVDRLNQLRQQGEVSQDEQD
jgi:hypothetical protein